MLHPSLAAAVVMSTLAFGCAHHPASPDCPQPESADTKAEEKSGSAEASEPLSVDPATGCAPEILSGPAEDDSAKAAKPAKKRSLKISLGKQSFRYAEDGEVVREGPVSSGAKGYSTPTGKFAVLSKDKDKVSSRYTNQIGMQAWMPYAIQFHGHYFLHEGWLPGYPDSHGCVRVGEKDARFLFDRLKIGDPVVVTR